jgi:hypothetical protein
VTVRHGRRLMLPAGVDDHGPHDEAFTELGDDYPRKDTFSSSANAFCSCRIIRPMLISPSLSCAADPGSSFPPVEAVRLHDSFGAPPLAVRPPNPIPTEPVRLTGSVNLCLEYSEMDPVCEPVFFFSSLAPPERKRTPLKRLERLRLEPTLVREPGLGGGDPTVLLALGLAGAALTLFRLLKPTLFGGGSLEGDCGARGGGSVSPSGGVSPPLESKVTAVCCRAPDSGLLITLARHQWRAVNRRSVFHAAAA